MRWYLRFDGSGPLLWNCSVNGVGVSGVDGRQGGVDCGASCCEDIGRGLSEYCRFLGRDGVSAVAV